MSAPTHRFTPRSGARRLREAIVVALFRAATYAVLLAGGGVFADILYKGSRTVFQAEAPFINTTFLFSSPESLHVFEWEGRRREMGDREFRAFREREPGAANVRAESFVYSAGGIWPCIAGTLLLVAGAMSLALAVGVSSAVYLSEYARDGRFIRFVRLAILNLAGVPSIVFGLFGFGMFVIFFGWNVSLIAGWFTLAFMVLPVVITASEEALKAVPYALPGILTSSILGIARVAGETAPIMFTAAYVVRDQLPWEVERAVDFLFQGVMALPYHIYVVSSKIPQNEYTERVQYGTAFVFLLLVALVAAASILLRNRLRARLRW
jgi:phosphate transport system permease protein